MSAVVGAQKKDGVVFPIGLTELDVQKSQECKDLCEKTGIVFTDSLVQVNINTQRLHLFRGDQLDVSYPISTGANGTGQKEGTGQTPLGLHYIKEKIGEDADPFAVFGSRKATGEIAAPEAGGKSIVGRILWLSGLQVGFNEGIDQEGNIVDTYNRYIYIHGTNDIENIGKLVSAGCVRMIPNHVVELFSKVPENTLVYIYS